MISLASAPAPLRTLRTRLGAALLLVPVLLAGLVACGGGSSDDGNPPAAGGPPITAGVQGLLGDWDQQGCVATGAQGFKKLLRARQTATTTIEYGEGVLSFGNRVCSGAGVQAGPSRLGLVVFDRSESDGATAANWGTFTTVTGTRFSVIWAKRGDGQLCLLGDQSPSIQPTLADVARSVATVPQSNCFVRR